MKDYVIKANSNAIIVVKNIISLFRNINIKWTFVLAHSLSIKVFTHSVCIKLSNLKHERDKFWVFDAAVNEPQYEKNSTHIRQSTTNVERNYFKECLEIERQNIKKKNKKKKRKRAIEYSKQQRRTCAIHSHSHLLINDTIICSPYAN